MRSLNCSQTRRNGRPGNTVIVGLLFGLCGLGGCASSVRDIGATATPVVVRSGLHAANEPDNQKQIQQLLDSLAVQKAGQSIGEGVGIGLFNQANKLTGNDATASAATDAGTPIADIGPGERITHIAAHDRSRDTRSQDTRRSGGRWPRRRRWIERIREIIRAGSISCRDRSAVQGG